MPHFPNRWLVQGQVQDLGVVEAAVGGTREEPNANWDTQLGVKKLIAAALRPPPVIAAPEDSASWLW